MFKLEVDADTRWERSDGESAYFERDENCMWQQKLEKDRKDRGHSKRSTVEAVDERDGGAWAICARRK